MPTGEMNHVAHAGAELSAAHRVGEPKDARYHQRRATVHALLAIVQRLDVVADRLESLNAGRGGGQ